MEYVNASGKPLDISTLARVKEKKPRPRQDAYHKGWLATGFPPQQLIDAKAEHERKAAQAAASDRRLLPWDEGRYMRDAKPTKIRSQPYATTDAAQAACDLAARAGWKSCTYSEVAKGK